jgi:outer membrane murein-binding lipoprotein Lpp
MESPRTSQELRDTFDFQNKWVEGLGFLLRFITLIGVIASIFFILGGISETKHQSQINQNYIRCIILIPANTYRGSVEQRSKAIDDCAVQSRDTPLTPVDNSINAKTIGIWAVILSIGAILGSIFIASRRINAKIDDVHSEIKTANSQSLAQLADADETRRIDKIPENERTQSDIDHAKDMKL